MSEGRHAAGSRPGQRKAPGLRVLVIDPSPDFRTRMKDTLRGIEVVDSIGERSSLHGLVELLGETPYHVVVVDEAAGEGNDVFERVHELRRHPAGKRTQFVVVSQGASPEMAEQAARFGVRGLVPKPYDGRSVERALVRAIQAHAEESGARPGPEGQPTPPAPEDRPGTAAPPRPAAATAGRGAEAMKGTLGRLRQVSLFSGFSDSELLRLLRICRTRSMARGERIFRDGDKGDSLFVIVSGKVEIRKAIGGEERVLVRMGPGDCFGEMAIIDDAPRMADAIAAEPTTAIQVDAVIVNNNEDIISLKLVRQIAILLARKLRKQSQG